MSKFRFYWIGIRQCGQVKCGMHWIESIVYVTVQFVLKCLSKEFQQKLWEFHSTDIRLLPCAISMAILCSQNLIDISAFWSSLNECKIHKLNGYCATLYEIINWSNKLNTFERVIGQFDFHWNDCCSCFKRRNVVYCAGESQNST